MNSVLAAEIDRLTPGEKLRLIEVLWDTLAKSPEHLSVPEAHQRALEEDQVDYRANPSAGSPWADVQARIMK